MPLLNIIKLFFTIIIIPLVFLSCFKKDVDISKRLPLQNQSKQKPIFRDSIEQIIIGCMLPLSGKYEKIGRRALNGLEFALYDFNNRYSDLFEIKLLVKDTRGITQSALQCLKELSEANVSAIIGPMIAVDPETQKAAEFYKKPLIILTNKEKILRSEDFVFRNFLTPKNQVEAIVSYAISKLGIKRFAILYPDENYGKNFMNLFQDEVSKYNADITIVEAYNSDATDFGTYIKKLITSYSEIPDQEIIIYDFDAIFIPDAPSKAGLIIPQLTYHDIRNVHILGTNLWHSDELIDIAEQYAEGAIIPDGFFPESEKESVKSFSKNFQKIYGKKPEFIEAVAYDTETFLLEVILKIKEGFFDNISHGFKNIKEYDGISGLIHFDNSGEAIKKVYLMTIDKSGFKEIE